MNWAELVAPMLGGFASTLHCLGMCGPLALMAETAAPRRGGVVLFLVAKTASYLLLGAALGLGAGLTAKALGPAVLRGLLVLAGTWFVGLGVELIRPGTLGRKAVAAGALPALARRVGELLPRGGRVAAVGLGMTAGFLPCPLSWGMATWAAASGGPLEGALLMVSFGLGTAPGLLLAAIAGRSLGAGGRTWLRRASGAAWVGLGLYLLGSLAILGTAPCCR